MSGLERLIPVIYHEKQQAGSQLCAQHALNAVFQGDYFQAPDLAQLAQQLDTLEEAFNENPDPVSNNMDDTGFFSVEVLERAVGALGFTLIRWRSELLRSQQEQPHCQMAFILNHQEHWFTMRRFGNLGDPENGHWFNLNSFLDRPEWISKLYLGMVLSQAEDEGYSVFAVLPLEDDKETLPHTEADDIAATLPQPTSSHMGARISTSHTHSSNNVPVASKPEEPSVLEDEDMELQAALQASLAAGGAFDYTPYSELNPARPGPSSFPSFPGSYPTTDDDSVEANIARSLRRNKAMMNQIQREQERALRETYDEEMEDQFGEQPGQTAGELQEDTALRQALDASRAERLPNDDDLNGEGTRSPQIAVPSHPPAASNRVYDDEDADFQAAIRASLEGLPEGFVMASPTLQSSGLPVPAQPIIERESTADVTQEYGEPEPTVRVDPEEIRRKRLARFGGEQ